MEKEKQSKLKGLAKATWIIARIGQVIVAIAMVCIALALIAMPIVLSNIDVNRKDSTIEIFGTQMEYEVKGDSIIISMDGEQEVVDDLSDAEFKVFLDYAVEYTNSVTIIALEISVAIIFVALIFFCKAIENFIQLFKNIETADTPFTEDNVLYLRKLAKYLITMIILTIIGELILALLVPSANFTLETTSIISILFVLCMSYVFEYGTELQKGSKKKIYSKE